MRELTREDANALEDLIRQLTKYCHAPGCQYSESCPAKHEECKKRLGLDTSIAWEAANILADLYSLVVDEVDLALKMETLCNIVERHQEYGKLWRLLAPARSLIWSV